jgi:cyclopropane fatty-acyl-phospholipid synthase-like methyltransferase
MQVDSYQHWMNDAEQASIYCDAQHAGSLGPGRTLCRLVDLSEAETLLDVGGGTGAMSIRTTGSLSKVNINHH